MNPEGRNGPGAVPPRRRAVAATVLFLLVGGSAGGGWALSQRRRPEPPSTPFKVEALKATALDGTGLLLPSDSAYTLLYVSVDCPFCRQEVTRWTSALSADSTLRPPLVVLATEASLDDRPWLAAFPGRVVVDRSHDIARALRVEVVPYTAAVDRGTVVAAAVGITSIGPGGTLFGNAAGTGRSGHE